MAFTPCLNASCYLVAQKISSCLRYRFSIREYSEIFHNQLGLCQPQAQSSDNSSIAGMSQVPAR